MIESRKTWKLPGWLPQLGVSITSAALVLLLWFFPTSPWVWGCAFATVAFSLITYFDSKYKYWRQARRCFVWGSVLAFTPTFSTLIPLPSNGVINFATDASPILVGVCFATGCFLSWLQSNSEKPQQEEREEQSGNSVEISQRSVVQGSNVLAGISAEKLNLTIGVSNDTHADTVKIIDKLVSENLRLTKKVEALGGMSTSGSELTVVSLIEEFRICRSNGEFEYGDAKAKSIEMYYRSEGHGWKTMLKLDALIVMAENEQYRIAVATSSGESCDDSALKSLMKEIEDVR